MNVHVGIRWTIVSATLLTIAVVHDIDDANALVQARGQRVQFSEAWFDRTCFGQLTAAMARRRCNELLDKRLELANQTTDLDPQQQRKLYAAGKADIHRFFSDYAGLKRQFQFGVISATEWEAKYELVQQESGPFVDQIETGLNGPDSLYVKTLETCLDPSTVEQIQASYQQYAQKRFAAKVDQTLRQVLRNAVERKSDVKPDLSVREHVTEVLIETTHPPEFYGNSRNYINTVVAKLMSVQEQLESILNQRELTMIRALYQKQHPANRKPIAASQRRG